jgi:ADP-ribose pyrophosphatase
MGNPHSVLEQRSVFVTPWFELVEKRVPGEEHPFYAVAANDYVAIVATTTDGRLILVRQYRPAVEAETLELPCGHVDQGQTPLEAARKELAEETGFAAQTLQLLGVLSPDTGRLANRMWCFHAPGAVREADGPAHPEPGIRVEFCDGSLTALLGLPEFTSALNLAAVALATAQGLIPVSNRTVSSPL